MIPKGQAGWAWQTGTNLTDPSIAVTDDSIVVAYVVEDGVNDPYIEVSNGLLTAQGVAFTARSVLHASPSNELDPFIFTDYHIDPTSSSVYLTFEHLYNEASNDVNILFERSGDDGDTWKDLSVVFGETVTHQIRDPVGCFGESTYHYLYVSGYNENTDTLWLRRCTDWGAGSWNSEQSILTLDFDPVYDTLPSIAASATAGTDNVVLVFSAGTGRRLGEIFLDKSVGEVEFNNDGPDRGIDEGRRKQLVCPSGAIRAGGARRTRIWKFQGSLELRTRGRPFSAGVPDKPGSPGKRNRSIPPNGRPRVQKERRNNEDK